MREIVIKQVDSMAIFKLTFIIFSFIGFVFGLIFSIIALIMMPVFSMAGDGLVSNVPVFPLKNILLRSFGFMLISILYGMILSFILLIVAQIYNKVSNIVGGITFYIEDNKIED